MNIGKSTKIALAMTGNNVAWLAEELNVTRQSACKMTRNKIASGTSIMRLCGVFELKASDFIALGED